MQSSSPLPARTTIEGASSDAGAQADTYLTSDLFNQFKAICGGCHVESNLGTFSVTSSTFPMAVTSTVLGYIQSDDPGKYMPPAGSPNAMAYSQRPDTDPVKQLAVLLGIWISQQSPAGSFTLPTQSSAPAAGYSLTTSLGSQLTNIGSCIPNKQMVGGNVSAMDQLDSFFAQATALPPTLDQTDLISLDSKTLAQSGVISYAPTYPLWSDDAGKMRYIRVPRGQSVTFDKATQTLTIPPNTRFYKTFLKQIIDGNGNPTYRKVETRVIVSRPDTTLADGTAQQNALYGTYLWNKEETQAQLSDEPLRDGLPFADRIFTYITDEQKDAAIMATNPRNLAAAENSAGITRHYAVPGSSRCVQCHMGSPSESFILGFTPLQVSRRATGTGGVYEPASGDELTQLQRLIDYGVITGVNSPSDVLPLEESEGSRLPRNVHELNAQAYMVGNCAHCHNPRGFPSIRQPAIANVLVFLPGTGPNEGIFQFDLTTTSPIRKRGLLQNVEIPYITPSLYDLPSPNDVAKYFCPDQTNGSCLGLTNEGPQFVLAPWRSLIYRNTDTPYDYFDDFTPFPHMPLNTSGYDCRVAEIMGDWMVSIPARVKDPTKPQAVTSLSGDFPDNANYDPQPYEEVLPSDPNYAAAVAATAIRMNQYHNGYRYGFCPTEYKADIVDPITADEVAQNQPVTSDIGYGFQDATNPDLMIMPLLAPVRPDYISYDVTDPPGAWFPRRPDWSTALVDPVVTGPTAVTSFITGETRSGTLLQTGVEDLTNVIEALENVTLTSDVRNALLQTYPFGLWDTSNSSCNFSGVRVASSFTGADKPQWMNVLPPKDPNAPVFVESSGAAVFTTVCFNCHGINADSQGLLADEINTLTGGDARVADFRDGILGPTTAPGMNRSAVFSDAAAMLNMSGGASVTTDDMAARYMAWMALGGTAKHLPQDVLSEVALSPVLGQVRTHLDSQGTPDMLRLGLDLCKQIATSDVEQTQISLSQFVATGQMGWSNVTGLVDINGDAEMWLRLCNLSNRPFVRAPSAKWTAGTTPGDLTISGSKLYWAVGPNGESWYGANPVMDQLGNVSTGVTASNLFPICIQKPTNATELQVATQALQANPVAGKNAIPFCPDGFIDPSHQLVVDTTTTPPDFKDGVKWAARGAINAALAVFLYLDQIERDPSKRQPLYTQCNLLGK